MINEEREIQEKDLGVIIDDRIKFEDHIYSKINVAYRNIGLIVRNSTHMSSELFPALYKALVRPHLKYF